MEYKKKPAVLLGLENIAELRWHTKDKLEGLILHELCHIIHVIQRGLSFKEFETLEEDPLFLLYSEGFAQRCEHLILNKELWRYAQDEKWLEWCIENEYLLAKEFLRRVKNGERVNEFFGSWLEIFGKSQTGYYLGYSFIKELEKKHNIYEIAKLDLDYIKEKAREFLIEKSQKFS